MRCGRLRAAVVVGLAIACGPPAGHASGKRPIAETDLFQFVWIADPQMSPDGTRVVFVHVTADRKADAYKTSLWTVPADASAPPRRLTAGPRDTAPRWAPDGRRLAFLRSVEKEGKAEPSQIYVMATDGGEARPATDLPKPAGAPAWSPDGTAIAFTSTVTEADLDERKKPAAPEKEAERRSDVRVITHAVYRANGGSYRDTTRPTHIWTVTAPDAAGAREIPAPRRVTAGAFDEQDPAWSTDGARIFFTSTRTAEPYYDASDRDLFSVPAAGGEISLVASIDGAIGAFALSPDGTRVAFIASENGKPLRSYNQPDLWIAPTARTNAASVRNLTVSHDFDIGGGLAGDQHAPRGSQPAGPIWSANGRFVVVVSAELGRANLRRVDAQSGVLAPLTTGDREVIGFSADAKSSRLAALVSDATNIGDLYIISPADQPSGQPLRLTDVNHSLFSELHLTPPEEIWYESFDGRKVQAWIQKPPDFAASKKYPLILNIHGGPHAAYGHTFFHEMQWMAAKGYLVLYPNPRGSTTYGQNFGNVIQYRYPGDDYKDLMAGVDELIRRGRADPQRLGVTGGSGGGLLTNWVITQTHRFAAAVSQRSIADWSGFWFTADFALFRPTWFRGAPWEDPKDFAERSPITHVAKVVTPLMLIEGEDDLRTPPSDGGEQMFRALKYLRKPTVMVRFPGESHELSRSGRPWHRVERLQHIVRWFDKYLKSS